MLMAHQLDGLVLVPNCDKIVPGMLLAVYIPEQLPQLGQQLQVQSSSWSAVIIPAL